MSAIEQHVDEFVKELNDECIEEFGVRYCYYEDLIWDWFLTALELDFDEVIEADVDYIAIFNKWVGENNALFNYTAMKKRANEQRKENAADLRTQAAEMGYHNYSSANGGTWYRD
tara:strand:+ start:417 stop:761 length:345 start_codon:yes stop_codon:yes gene_type:complete